MSKVKKTEGRGRLKKPAAYLGPFLASFRPFFPAIFGFYMVPDGPGSTPDQYKKNLFLTFFYNFGFLVITGCFFNPVTFSFPE